MSRARQRGVALLTVLLLVAVMAVLVIGMLDDIRFGVRRVDNASAVAQAQWHALGAESLARAQIERLAQRDPARTTLAGDWNGRPFLFPIEHGAIRASLADGNACFNLNSVVDGAPGEYLIRRDAGVSQYRALLLALGFPEHQAQALVDTLVDWIDSDQERSAAGHEDEAYARGRNGYRTGGTLLAEASELRALRGYTPAVYARLRRYVCALPGDDLSPVNVNTLEPEDAPVLSMLTGGGLDPARARRVIAARPADGWPDFESFWHEPGMDGIGGGVAQQQIALRSRYFRLHAEVDYGTAQVVLSALFEHDGNGPAKLLSRRWSADE